MYIIFAYVFALLIKYPGNWLVPFNCCFNTPNNFELIFFLLVRYLNPSCTGKLEKSSF